VIASKLRNEGQIGIAEVAEACDLLGGRHDGKTAVAFPLHGGEKADRHRLPSWGCWHCKTPLVVCKLDRLARSTRDLLEIMEITHAAGAAFRSLSEPWADTTTHAGKMILTVFAGIAEFERDLIRERTGAGRIIAKAKGVRFGRPRKLNTEQRALALRLLREGRSAGEVAKTFRVLGVTIYRLAAAEAAAITP
jgi:hypothetical protein